MAGAGSVHIASKFYAKTLLCEPDAIVFELSLKVFERRQQMLCSMQNTVVRYMADGLVTTGVLHSFDATRCTVGSSRMKISLSQLVL